MQRTALVASILALVTGCGSGSEAPASVASATAAPATPVQLAKPPVEARGRKVAESNKLYEFEYAYPAAVGGVPALKAELDKRLAASRAELEKHAKEDQSEAAKDGYPYRPHSATTAWQVVADLPAWLSLSAELYDYSGGAHGMSFYDGLVWDKQANRVIKPIGLFTSKAALSAAIREPFCAALDKEREKRRGEPVNRNSGDQFDECIDPAESTLILGSSNGRTFDRIGVLIEPYAAGAYAEGSFDLTLPVTPAALAAVKPQYRAAFSVKK